MIYVDSEMIFDSSPKNYEVKFINGSLLHECGISTEDVHDFVKRAYSSCGPVDTITEIK